LTGEGAAVHARCPWNGNTSASNIPEETIDSALYCSYITGKSGVKQDFFSRRRNPFGEAGRVCLPILEGQENDLFKSNVYGKCRVACSNTGIKNGILKDV